VSIRCFSLILRNILTKFRMSSFTIYMLPKQPHTDTDHFHRPILGPMQLRTIIHENGVDSSDQIGLVKCSRKLFATGSIDSAYSPDRHPSVYPRNGVHREIKLLSGCLEHFYQQLPRIVVDLQNRWRITNRFLNYGFRNKTNTKNTGK
jgi:hypothetical protein